MGLIWYQIYEDCAMNNEIIGWYCHNWNTYFLLIKEIDRVGGESVLQNQIEYLNQRCNTDRIFKILRTMEIFWSCLLPKMRLSIVLEGRYTGYQNSLLGIQNSWNKHWIHVVNNLSIRIKNNPNNYIPKISAMAT